MPEKKVKLTVIADPHYYSRKLGYEGRAYTLRSESDQKCLAETSEIVDAVFKKIAESDTDAVLIAGDLSNDGEIVSHEEFREKLRELQKHKPVFVITATHDFCSDNNPRRYDGENVYHDVETMPADKLRDFYYEFGPKQASDEFFTHLGTSSYAVDFNDKLKLLCFNDDQSGMGGSGFSEEHFQWIEKQMKDAREKDMMVISMEHHLLVKHIHPMVSGGGMSVKDEEKVASRLADMGLKYSFVGHSHMTDVKKFTSPAGNTITSINVGSICGYPAPIAVVTVNDDRKTITLDFDYLDSFEGVADAQAFFKEHALNLINKTIEGVACGDKNEFIDRIKALNAPADKLVRFRFLLKPAAKFVDRLTVKKAYRILNLLTFGRVIDKKWTLPYRDEKVMDIGRMVFLNIFNAQQNRFDRESDFYKLVTSVVSIPSRILKKNKALRQINELVDVLVAGNDLNNFPIEL